LIFKDLFSFGTGVFALILFMLSLYAWFRRKQPSLIIVSVAFFLFFFKEIVEFLPTEPADLTLVMKLIDFVILALFFVAITIRPRRSGSS
jgi:hypothetical protein